METVIIGIRDDFRNPRLSNLLSLPNVRTSEPVFITDFEEAKILDQELNKLLLGRSISLGEAGCLLAHSQCWKVGGSDWMLVLEDDVSLDSEIFDAIREFSEKLRLRGAAVVHLFDGKAKGSSRPRLRRLFFQPGGAVAYLINSAARALAPDELIGTADWPFHFTGRVKFYSYWGLGISEEIGSSSVIGTSRAEEQESWRFYLSAVSRLPRILLKFGINGLMFSFVLPLLRDLYFRLVR